MKHRVNGLIGSAASKISIGTFHSTSARLLRVHGARIGINTSFAIMDGEDCKRIIKRIFEQLKARSRSPPFSKPIEAISAISKAKNRRMLPEHCRSSRDKIFSLVSMMMMIIFVIISCRFSAKLLMFTKSIRASCCSTTRWILTIFF